MLLLAVVRDGKFTPLDVCKVDPIEDGSRWLALDSWGGVAGTLQKAAPSGLDQFRLLHGTRGTNVYVSAADDWKPPPSARWVPSAPEAASFERWRPRRAGSAGPARFFASTEPRREFAVVAGYDRLFIALHAGAERWQLVHEESYEGARWRLFQLRLVVDMTGDGVPEVVYHFNEQDDGYGHEVVLKASRTGRSWSTVAENYDDCP